MEQLSFFPVIVRSPFRAKHHVVVQYMAAGLKCPLPPTPYGTPLPPVGPPSPYGPPPPPEAGPPPPTDSMISGRQGG